MILLALEVDLLGHLLEELLHCHRRLLKGHELASNSLRMTTGLPEAEKGVQQQVDRVAVEVGQPDGEVGQLADLSHRVLGAINVLAPNNEKSLINFSSGKKDRKHHHL